MRVGSRKCAGGRDVEWMQRRQAICGGERTGNAGGEATGGGNADLRTDRTGAEIPRVCRVQEETGGYGADKRVHHGDMRAGGRAGAERAGAVLHRENHHQFAERLLLAGVYSYTRMPTSLFPEVPFPRITVIADAGKQPIDRMMITVTKPLESVVKKVNDVTTVKSSTGRGSCVVDIYFRWGTDIYAQKMQVESRINEIKGYLPAGYSIRFGGGNKKGDCLTMQSC